MMWRELYKRLNTVAPPGMSYPSGRPVVGRRNRPRGVTSFNDVFLKRWHLINQLRGDDVPPGGRKESAEAGQRDN